MQFTTPLVRGTLLRRYKRFLADVELDSGELVTAHCPNTGAMTGCAEPGYTVFLSQSDNPKRKLRYTWELALTDKGHYIGINTHNANKLVAEALENKVFAEFNLFDSWKAEVTPPGADSRFDFALESVSHRAFMEVKSVTLLVDGQGYFPDARTTRGAKHCLTLAQLAQQGIETYLFFCVQHTGISSVEIAKHIDPAYADAVMTARKAGVKLLAAGCEITNKKLVLNQLLPVAK